MSIEVGLARLIRPFPVARLADALYQVQAGGAGIGHRLDRLHREPPSSLEDWRFELQALDTQLWALEDYCRRARARIEGLYDSSEHDYQLGLRAVTAMLRGLGAGAEHPVTDAEDDAFGHVARVHELRRAA